ncbi:MAG: paraquat-inducible protein A [Phycisphaerales bacterium]|nr:paraquat-inducible protein A [Phycisphaerales bacterium]NNM25656.1 paraquat-inducible protein A [Phycisphaerales bacterium]
MPRPDLILACPCCGLAQTAPAVLPPRTRACCGRCGSSLMRRSAIVRSNQRTAALALAALVLYPFAVGLPMIEIERFGHVSASSILAGISALLGDGHWVIGLIVLACSVVLPIAKLATLLVMTVAGGRLRHRHRVLSYRLVELTGRWGMLDVLLVTLLVAIVKLGDLVTVTAGPATLAFAAVVVLSLCAGASFDPHALWEAEE